MKKNIILKIVCIIFIVISVYVFIRTNFMFVSSIYDGYTETYYITLITIEIINIIFGVLFFRTNKITNKHIITYLAFLLLILCIPVYYQGRTCLPTGPDSYLMGVAFEEKYLDIYGLNISKLVEIFK